MNIAPEIVDRPIFKTELLPEDKEIQSMESIENWEIENWKLISNQK